MSDLNCFNTDRPLPVVAIVGRPNVGKSTLFNRLIRRRRAITDPTPGVTRDLIEEPCELQGRTVLLVDSGGVTLAGEGFDDQVTEKSKALLESADVILLLLEVHEITPEDETLIEWVRPFQERLVVGVNKVDHANHEGLIWDAYRYGFSTILPLSAEHGRGIDELQEALASKIDFSQYSGVVPQKDPPVRIAVMGKPNTGKSTLVNRLVGKDLSIISDIPGTTRDVISGDIAGKKGRAYRILDTAGIRRKKKVGQQVEYYSVNRAISSINQADIILLMVDAAEGLAEQDKKIASLVTRKGKGIILVLNKWDLMEQTPNQLRAVRDRVRFLFPVLSFAPILPISAQQGSGIESLMKHIDLIYDQLTRRVETSRFNAALSDWVERNEPPRDAKGRFKILYGTQVKSNPIQFVIFVNRKERFPRDYLGYLTNNIRRELGFEHVPISLELRQRSRRDGHGN